MKKLFPLLVLSLLLGATGCQKDDETPEVDPIKDNFEFIILTGENVQWEAVVTDSNDNTIGTAMSTGQDNFYTPRTGDGIATIRVDVTGGDMPTSFRVSYRDLSQIFDGKTTTLTIEEGMEIPFSFAPLTINFNEL